MNKDIPPPPSIILSDEVTIAQKEAAIIAFIKAIPRENWQFVENDEPWWSSYRCMMPGSDIFQVNLYKDSADIQFKASATKFEQFTIHANFVDVFISLTNYYAYTNKHNATNLNTLYNLLP